MVNKKIRQKKKLYRQNQRVKRKKESEITVDFPFIRNRKVVGYIKMSKVMYIMRGLPGSGKSTIVNLLQEKYPNSVVCSADFFLTKDGKYEFDQSLLKDAHEHCKNLAQNSCEKNNAVVIIDNTNTMKWEMKYYLELAVTFNYVVILIVPKTSWRFDPVKLALRNTHGVLEEYLQKMAKRFQDVIPLYYGWFLNEIDSQKLLDLGNKYRQLCLDHFVHFREVLLRLRQDSDTDVPTSSMAADDEKWLHAYFTRVGAAGILHCTSRFCRWGKVEGSAVYHCQTHIQEACGKLYQLTVSGMTITPRTIAIRVKLHKPHLRLWQNDAKEPMLPSPSGTSPNDEDSSATVFKEIATNQISAQSKTTGFRAEKTSHFTGHGQKTLFSDNPFSVLNTENENSGSEIGAAKRDDEVKGDNSGDSVNSCRGLSAHITLGYAQGCRAQQSGPDIAEIAKIASKNKPNFVQNLDGAVMNYYGEGRCEVIFKPPFKVNSIFSGHY